MTDVDVEKLLDPRGEALRAAIRGKWGLGRMEVTLSWPYIEKALDAGARVGAIWEALHRNGLVSVTKRTFARRVKARREGAKSSAAAAKPAAEPGLPKAKGAGREWEPRGSWRKVRAKRRTTH
jgi:hypothetical protein